MRSSFCSWVCLRSNRVLTTNEPLQGSFERLPRPPLQGGFGTLVWCTPECDCCVLTCPNEPRQEGKRTLVRFNRTKWGRCESTLSLWCPNRFSAENHYKYSNCYHTFGYQTPEVVKNINHDIKMYSTIWLITKFKYLTKWKILQL